MQHFVLLLFAKQQKFDSNFIVNQILELLKGLVSIFVHEKVSRDVRQQTLSVLSYSFQLVCQYLGENYSHGDEGDEIESNLQLISGDIYRNLLVKVSSDEKTFLYDHISQLLAIFANDNFYGWSESNFSTVYESLREGLEHSWNQQCQTQAAVNLMNIFALLTMLAMKR